MLEGTAIRTLPSPYTSRGSEPPTDVRIRPKLYSEYLSNQIFYQRHMSSCLIEQSLPRKDELLALLNDAYDGWGGDGQFEWKYDRYPGYDEDQCYHIDVDGELAAFRRVFEKEIESDSGTEYSFFVLGDTCVSPSHQGEGLYSSLHARTTEDCESYGSDLCATFNRTGNVTFKANRNRGWEWRTLPIQVRVLSPEVVIPNYASLALEDSEFGDRLLSCLPAQLYNLIPAKGVAAAVEVASSERGVGPQTERSRRTTASAGHRKLSTSVLSAGTARERIDEIRTLYAEVLASYDLHFSRDPEQIRHMLSHPDLEGVIAVEDGDRLSGFAPVVVDRVDGIREATVLDVVAAERPVARRIATGVERAAIDADADLVVALSEPDLGPCWSRVDKQVFMWDSLGPDTGLLEERSLFVGLYDTV